MKKQYTRFTDKDIYRLKESSHLLRDSKALEIQRDLLKSSNVNTPLTLPIKGVAIWEAETHGVRMTCFINKFILSSKVFQGLSPQLSIYFSKPLISTNDSTVDGISLPYPTPYPMCTDPFPLQVLCSFLGPNVLSPTHIHTSYSRKPFHLFTRPELLPSRICLLSRPFISI